MSDDERTKPGGPAGPGKHGLFGGLSSRLLALTVLFVMVTEVFIFVPSVANFREIWLRDKVEKASVAAAAVIAADGMAPEGFEGQMLEESGAKAMALSIGGMRRLIAMTPEEKIAVDLTTDLRSLSPLTSISEALDALTAPDGRTLRIIGIGQDSGGLVDIVIDETPLRAAMWVFARNILVLSLIISAVTAALVFISLRRLFVRPMARLTRSMMLYRENPSDASRIITPSGRDDEIGDAEMYLEALQKDLSTTLTEQKRLADLGLAVSKINHDLRNILAAAQLFSDRLADLPDPQVQRLAPRILRSLDRAVGYTRSVLAYGKAREAPPNRRYVKLRQIADEAADILSLNDHPGIEWENGIPDDIEVSADPEQLFRVFLNLLRNAVQVLEAEDDAVVVRRIWTDASADGGNAVIRICDSGPGVPDALKEKLFRAFEGSNRNGGSGLGLAIAAELITAHGGSIRLVTDTPGSGPGTTFEISLPLALPGSAGRAKPGGLTPGPQGRPAPKLVS